MTRRSRAALIGAVTLVAAACVVGAIALLSPAPRVTSPPLEELAPNARTAVDFAQLACVHATLANQAVRAGGAAETVRRELAAARALAAEAVRRDGRFAALSGGLAALDEAVRRDDGEAAAVGLRVALEQCEGLRR